MFVIYIINLCMFMFDVAWKLWNQYLRRLREQVDMDGRRNVVNVTRDDVLDGARRGFRRTKFNNNCVLSVKFSGEAGIDDGGPTREFMPHHHSNQSTCIMKIWLAGTAWLIMMAKVILG